jgi:hypothetical protein
MVLASFTATACDFYGEYGFVGRFTRLAGALGDFGCSFSAPSPRRLPKNKKILKNELQT